MSYDTTTAKKRKAMANDDVVEGFESSSAAAAMMEQMKAHMARMQNEMAQHLQNEIDSMKSKCNKLEAKCDSLERCVQILMKENKWEYSAPSIPTNHWTELGFGEYYIKDMESFLREIKSYTQDLRSGKCPDIYLSSLMHLHYDDLLLPHWEEFANALQLYHLPQDMHVLKFFQIHNVQLTSSVMDLLASTLKGKAIWSFGLRNNGFVNTRVGLEFAVKYIEGNPNLEQFYWVNNPIDSVEDARYLVDAIISHPRIDKVSLVNCFGDDINGYDAFRCLFTSGKSFLRINLEGNNIRTWGSTEIPDSLATNTSLVSIYLANNHLNDGDAVLIAHALKRKNNLYGLHLGDNDLTDIGRKALSNAIYDFASLNSLSDCNHSCNIEGIDFGGIPANENHPIHVNTPKCNRARKIYHLLSLRNLEGSNVQHLNLEFDDEDDSLTVVPRVLGSVHWYSMHRCSRNLVHPLSIMYEILRSWKMPELFENSGLLNKAA